MRRFCLISSVCLLLLAVPVRAEDPFRLIPADADFAAKVEAPAQLVEAVQGLDILQQLDQIEAVQDFIGSSEVRRFFQLVGYFEKELGAPLPELIDKVAGGGIALSVIYGSGPQPALFVIQGKDEAMLRKFVKLGLQVVEQEVTRQEQPFNLTRKQYRKLETLHIGNDLHAAIAGSALVVSNRQAALHQALDLHLDTDKKNLTSVASVKQARALLPKKTMAWLWLNMESVRELPQVKDGLDQLNAGNPVNYLFGSWIDLFKRTPLLTAGLARTKKGFLVTARVPAGRKGSTVASTPFIPPTDVAPSLPLLKPRGVMLSSSYYWDVSKYWTERAKYLNAQQRQTLEQFNATSKTFLAGNSFSKLLQEAGPYQRLVVAHQDKLSYKVEPDQRIPAFGVVLSTRKPGFGKSMNAIIRAAALFGSTQVRMKLVEEKYKEVDLVGYRFREDQELAGDTQNLRFNFSPCFATVGDQFFIASTRDLGRELVDLLKNESTAPKTKKVPNERTVFYSNGAAELLRAFEEQILVQTMLDRALPAKEAQQQVNLLIKTVQNLGTVQLESRYGENDFHYNIRLNIGKKKKK